ncbi:TIGR03759 family integrating conjugative element protein [Billgrantia ethanolica]|uniref:TIGR03759 family integrating conjugative element protein n=1 Tax=Billgrantia ethanolica TaxID=2733486 RepID=A0ABS9A922_9GAMM|nr:TIGR03759 family integrating conjugative element protein [Halomonas ethanolica]MCE8005312.1 TIGR03759 family integrating conjugative element protein [Halomonas ethanolica]
MKQESTLRLWWTRGLTLGLGLTAAAGTALAQQAVTEASLEVEASSVRETLRAEAREWGLTDQEWERYETLMEGSRGIWSPDLDPLTALGVEARSDQERRRYAELLVEVEKARVESELAFQRAYDEAWQRLYPNELPVDSFLTSAQGQVGVFPATANQSQASRLSLHVAARDCAECDATVAQLLDSGVPMDVFVIDSEGDDGVIRQWARERSIPVSRVQAREITLNHGQIDASLGVTQESVPQIFSR